MAWFWWLLGIFIVILWVVTIVDIIRRRHERSGAKTAAWILIVVIFPVIGTLVYFLVNGVGGGPMEQREAELDRMTGERY
jgi:hypothetical protein